MTDIIQTENLSFSYPDEEGKAPLAALNGVVHPAVRSDFRRWAGELGAEYVVAESAVLFESGMDREVDEIVTVSAPERLRLERAVGRDRSSEEEVRARMRSQMNDAEREALAGHVIFNDEKHLLWKQVLRLDARFGVGRR